MAQISTQEGLKLIARERRLQQENRDLFVIIGLIVAERNRFSVGVKSRAHFLNIPDKKMLRLLNKAERVLSKQQARR